MSKLKHILLALSVLCAISWGLTSCGDSGEDATGGVNRTVVSLSTPVVNADAQIVYLTSRSTGVAVKINAEIRILDGGEGWCSFDENTTAYQTGGRVGTPIAIYLRQNTSASVRKAIVYVALSDGTRESFSLDQQPASENESYDRIWGEQPSFRSSGELIHKTYFTTLFHDLKSQGGSGRQVRNYSVCYDTRRRVSLWVAYPLHTCYTETTAHLDSEVGISGRLPYDEQPWTFDPNTQKPYIPKEAMYVMRTYGGGYDRGHQIPSADRYSTRATNAMTYYSTNMTPQRGKMLNQEVWARLEGFVRGKMVSDTLYVVTGCHFENDTKTVSMPSATGGGTVRVGVPTHYFKVLLRTRSGRTGKSVSQCKADELQAVGFLFENKDYPRSEQVSAKYVRSVAEIESLTGFNFFRNLSPSVARSVKTQKNARDWGL